MTQQIKEAVQAICNHLRQGLFLGSNDTNLMAVLNYANKQASLEPEEKTVPKIVINVEGMSYIKNVFSDHPVEVMVLNQINKGVSVIKIENTVNEFVVADSISALTNLESLKAQVVEKF